MPPSDRGLGLPAAIALLLTVVATPAAATDTCVVQKSADGYVALRAKPSAGGALLARAKESDGVVIQQSHIGPRIASGSWLWVLYFPGSVIPPKTDPAYKKGRVGWMHKRYVSDCG